jgi:hypothetical protein
MTERERETEIERERERERGGEISANSLARRMNTRIVFVLAAE